MARRGVSWLVNGLARPALALVAVGLAALAASPAQAATRYAVGPIRDVSAGCGGQNAEVEQAVDPARGYVYETWIGCGGIGFARSTDGGKSFESPVRLRSSAGGWDPALAVAADGTLYAAFMVTRGRQSLPLVLASFDHGASFPQLTALSPPRKANWGDRDFIAAGPGHTVYVTWDYGPSMRGLRLLCYAVGSCAITGGELNIVMQASSDGGRSFGPMVRVSPRFPAGGGVSGPLLVEPGGRIDVFYEQYGVRSRRTLALGAGGSYFTSSVDGGHSWSRPVLVGGSAGKISPYGWWIDGALGADTAGDLYATWDTQRRRHDIGWLSYSIDHGVTWSRPIRVSPYIAKVGHIVEVAGGAPGVAYVAWLTNRRPRGYAEYLRTFAIGRGWLSGPRQISRRFGNARVWPGDTFGISTLSPGQVLLSWGSAVRPTRGRAEIFAAPVGVTGP